MLFQFISHWASLWDRCDGHLQKTLEENTVISYIYRSIIGCINDTAEVEHTQACRASFHILTAASDILENSQ